jgi:sigma-B regulation protein RsbU (phosphoserine phosphatase)
MSDVKGNLLLVDDNPENRDMLARRLQRRGYLVSEAENGARALELAAASAFDVVLLDIMMPVMDGLEALRRLRETRSVAELPIIMTTAKGESDDVVQALKLGANDYVTKPINFPVALARIETQVSLRRAVQQIRNLELDLAARNRELAAANDKLSQSNARMKRDLEAAARIQQTFLPAAAPTAGGLRFAWRYRPCDELAGDTLNVVPLDEHHVGVFVVDVSGHGVPAALLSVTVSRLLSRTTDGCPLVRRGSNGSNALEIVPPAEVAAELTDRFPFDAETRQYFTCVYGVLDTRSDEFRYVCAGHPGPVHVPRGRAPVRHQPTGRPIGIVPASLATGGYTDHLVALAPGDRIYLYTDGIPEAENGDQEQFGFDRLQESLAEFRDRPLQAGVEDLVNRVEAWCSEGGVTDDISILAIER